MNPTEIYQFFTTLIRDGAEMIAAFIVGMIAAVYILWQFGLLGTAKLRKRIAELEHRVNQELEKRLQAAGQVAVAENLLVQARKELSEEHEKRIAREANLEEAQKKLAQAEKDLQSSKNKLNELKAPIKELTGQNGELTTKQAVATEQIQTLSAEKSKLQELARAFQKKVVQLTNHATEKDRRIDTDSRIIEEQASKLDTLNADYEVVVTQRDELQRERDQYRKNYGKKCKQFRILRNHIDNVVCQGGRTWEKPVTAEGSPFIPLVKRKCPIISLLNLKGGVGKTTLALNIAATLAGQGKRVLLVDLDHQRSLSHLCVRTVRRTLLHKSGRSLHHFLLDPEKRTPAYFLSCVEPVNGIERCSIVINSDPAESKNEDNQDIGGLASAEETLLLDWVTRMDAQFDVRLFLRGALHDPLVVEQFDYVLLDCPPRLTTASINALAACDFVLVPVGLDAVASSNPLPHLFRELRRLRAPERFPNLTLLGIIVNRVLMSGSTLQGDQMAVWDNLGRLASDQWRKPVHLFETPIKNALAFSRAARILVEEHDSAAVIHQDAVIRTAFKELVLELQERITHESQQFTGVHSQPGSPLATNRNHL